MAVNEILAARFNAILNKLLSIKGGAPSPILSPEIIPTISLETDRPEWQWLGGGQLCMGGVRGAAVALQNPLCFLRNPADSGVIATVEGVLVYNRTRQDMYTVEVSSPVTAVGTTNGIRRYRDARALVGITALPVCTIAAATSAGAVFLGPRMNSLFGTTAVTPPIPMLTTPFVLMPNSQLEVLVEQANADVDYSFFWRERPVDPSELR